MTDKQIIMDSSKCKHYWNGNCSDWDNTLIGACDDFEDCYCKMYLRKEQECEKAKQNAQDTYDLWQALIKSFNILQGEKIKLEQECEQLKEELQKYKDNEQQEKEMLKLYNKFDGSSLIEKRSPYGQF